MNADIVSQTKAAFDFMEKLYLETSYLVKDIEGILYDEDEKFVIGRPVIPWIPRTPSVPWSPSASTTMSWATLR